MNTTTTNPTHTARPGARRSVGSGSIWKSAIVAASFTGVLLGWAVLGRGDADTQESTAVVTVETVAASESSVVNVQSQLTLPTMPQKPVFQRPVTSTRRS